MANRLKKMMAPILKEECDKAYKKGFEDGKQVGWEIKKIAYENVIESLKGEVAALREKIKQN